MATTLTATNQEFKPQAWEQVGCPLCGAKDSFVLERFGYQHRYTYCRCNACGLAFQNPRPNYNAEFVEIAYEHYCTDIENHYKEGRFTGQGKVVYDEYKYILKEMEVMYGKKGRILDVGCNTGMFIKVAKDQGWQPVGAEISRTMVEIAKKYYEVDAVAGDWLEQDYGKPFDVAYCSHVIEHIPNPEEWMNQFKKVLKPDGLLCLSVPNMNSIDRRFKRVLKRIGLKKDKWQAWRTPDHLFEPDEKSMEAFFKRTGWELLSTYTYPSEWHGEAGSWHRFYHFLLRWGAKQRFYLKPLKQ